VLRQPGGIAFDIFDARIAGVARQFEDFSNAEKAGALITARRIERWPRASACRRMRCRRVDAIELGNPDRFGRVFEQASLPRLLRHQGDRRAVPHAGRLAIDAQARVLRQNGRPFPNLFAAGGAAVGVSGSQAPAICRATGCSPRRCSGASREHRAAKL
jgi:fumarate reductase flavoprotein subunit